MVSMALLGRDGGSLAGRTSGIRITVAGCCSANRDLECARSGFPASAGIWREPNCPEVCCFVAAYSDEARFKSG